jgi:hypothetical protein
MKNILFTLIIILLAYNSFSQNIAIKSGSSSAGSSITQSLKDSTVIVFDAILGTSASVTIAGNRQLLFSNFNNGMFLSLAITQDATGSRALTLPDSKVINGGIGVISLTQNGGAKDVITFFKINNIIYCNYGKNYN